MIEWRGCAPNCGNVRCSSLFVCNLLGSDGSLSGSEGEEQELWEETQIVKGVKRHPGDQVG